MNRRAAGSRTWVRLAIPRALFCAGFLLVLGFANLRLESPAFLESNGYLEGIVIAVGLYIIMAVALNLVNGMTGQFSLGHIGFYAIGTYVAGAFSTYGHNRFFSHIPLDHTPLPVPLLTAAGPVMLTCVLSGLCAAAVGFVVGLPSLRLRGDYLAIITLGFAQIIQVVIRNIPQVNGDTSFVGLPTDMSTVTTGVQTIELPHLTCVFWVFLAAGLAIWVSYAIRFSAHGLAFLAVREDEIAAEAMGINTTRYKVTAFVLSAFFTGIAGALYALYQPSLTSDQFSFIRGIDVVVMVVLGGLGSISGVTIAAILLVVLPELLRAIADYRLVVYPLLLIVLMLTRPQGIFGRDELSMGWLKGQAAAIRGWFRRPAIPPAA